MCFTVQLSRFLSCDSHIRLSHLFWLVKNFFHFLENFFFKNFWSSWRAPLSPTAMLEYHSISPLSTSFLNLLKIIFFIYNLEYSNNLFITTISYVCVTNICPQRSCPMTPPAQTWTGDKKLRGCSSRHWYTAGRTAPEFLDKLHTVCYLEKYQIKW